MTSETLEFLIASKHFFQSGMFQPSENTDLSLAEVTSHPTAMADCNDADSPSYKKSGVST
jgi:hypothetical protein